MTERHHPLPSDDRARHDQIPESVEDEREVDDGGPRPSTTKPPEHEYRDPDGRPYRT